MNNSEIFMVLEHRGPKKMNNKKLFIVPGQYGPKKMNNRKIFIFSAPLRQTIQRGLCIRTY
ncbi:hypothetical protein B0533_13015 [Sedimentibacter sp. SX930]|nr:hypothetical protein B0533_13015 [Sedimentibacter sp. SX930]